MTVRCGHDCSGTEELRGFCDCIRCANCYRWIHKCGHPQLCEWYDERNEWTDEDGRLEGEGLPNDQA